MEAETVAKALEKLDLARYSRQVGLLGALGQIRLASTSIAVVGLGGLGNLAAAYLAAAGVGRLILVDGDKVELNNLNRQVIYKSSDLGRYKAVIAAERVSEINPDVDVEPIPENVDPSLAAEIARKAEIIIDGLDNWRARLMLDAAAWREGKHLIHGAAERLYGQVTTVARGKSPCLACIAPARLDVEGCRSVVAPTVGVVASLQVLEALKIASGFGQPLYSKLAVVDLSKPSIETIHLKTVECSLCVSRIRSPGWVPSVYG